MKTIATLGLMLGITGGVCSAARFTGKLMDADCYNTNKVESRESGHKTYHSITRTCAPTASTTNFALRITDNAYSEDLGQTIKLDDVGNRMAASAIQSGAVAPDGNGKVSVRVKGKLLGETFKTTSFRGSSSNSNIERSE